MEQGVCAFCGEGLITRAPGSLGLSIGSSRVEMTQGFVVHAECLAGRLHEGAAYWFDASMFESHGEDESDADDDVRLRRRPCGWSPSGGARS